MQRRDALRIFAAGAVLPVFSPELFALFRQAQPPPGYALRTLTPHLNDTVMAMIDQIIPATDTPGAKGARVNEFIDVILSEWATPEERTHFLEVFKRITVHGYYTSEIGFTQELKLQIIPGAQHGCALVGPGLGDA